jgi:hypothetical protein
MLEKNDIIPTGIVCGLLGLGVYLYSKTNDSSNLHNVHRPDWMTDAQYKKLRNFYRSFCDSADSAVGNELRAVYNSLALKIKKGEYSYSNGKITVHYIYNKRRTTYDGTIGTN